MAVLDADQARRIATNVDLPIQGRMQDQRPLIGITADLVDGRYQVRTGYAELISASGGVPVVLPCEPALAPEFVARCAGIVLTGGDDPIMERWGLTTHPKAKPVDQRRQDFELALLDSLQRLPDQPVLGVCLGMQLMGLHAGGTLDQHLPDTLATAGDHWGRGEHAVTGSIGSGRVHSHHRQALTDAGVLDVIATAPDGVVEAIQDQERAFYVGVQWHPERTTNEALGSGLFQRLIECAGGDLK
jgi:putative glutamine amidotransferase